ncbi:methyl-accepting chemotaxis protein [Rheinheimera sp. EpRS3]|uniref:methyl-accepting chemotaxis protein n=1 Tax=Rheinheimera sp. EpRS3 TaxID=1712383 RepID=UPI00074A1B66|nr:methyl-accepting chemotaxis protein [Rheinheimera sp. EpRS3]KUM55200.1 hypothetical protein AR688_18370 [Rheinheimera sp. EpRS3]
MFKVDAVKNDSGGSGLAIWLLPLYLSLISIIVLFIVAGWSFLVFLAACFLLCAGGVMCWLLKNSISKLVSVNASQAKLQAEQQFEQNARQFLTSLNSVEGDVAAVWARQIETGRAHSEQSVVELVGRFHAIVQNLEDTVRLSDSNQEDSENTNAIQVLNTSSEKLHSMVHSLKEAMSNRDALLQQVGQLVSYIDDLKSMATAVANIADQTNLLALNAAIEAARAGDSGRGFSVVAAEVRALSNRSGETGRRISDTVNTISSAISGAFSSAESFASQDVSRVQNAEQDINTVLNDFKLLTDHLNASADELRGASIGIKSEIAQSLVHLQFQDRVSQILSHVRDNILLFPDAFAQSAALFQQQGKLVPIDWTSLLDELMKSYATEEELANHGQLSTSKTSSTDSSDDLVFF